jgi:mRNA interferase RelE/StbE
VPYSLKIKKSALKELQQLDKPTRERLVTAIDQLAENPHVGKLLKGDFSGLRRLRVGIYRIIYEINETEVLVLVVCVAHRKDVYHSQPS